MKKLISIVCIAMAFIFVLSGCASVGGDQSLADVKKAGKIRLGFDDHFPPMGFHDITGGKDKITGFDIDMAGELAKKMGVKLELVPTDWNGVFAALNSHKFDVIINGLSITDDRKKKVDFSKPYMYNNQVIVIKEDNKSIKTKEDLKGKIIGCQSGSTSEDAVTKLKNVKDVKKYSNNELALQDLKNGRTDAVVIDEIVAKYFRTKGTITGITILNDTLGKEPYGIGYRKGDKAFQKAMNDALDQLYKDGTMKKLSVKWFGEDITAEQ